MNSSGEIFAMNEDSKAFAESMIREKVRGAEELEEKERQALVDIPQELLQTVASMNRKERRAFYKKAMRRRGRGYTR